MWDFIAIDVNEQLSLSANLQSWLESHALNIAIILIGAWALRRVLSLLAVKIVERTVRGDMYPTDAERKKRVKTLNSLVGAVIRMAVWLVAGTMIIDEFGVNTAPLLASAGVVGIALGFGAQSLIKDFVSGIFIIIENQYRVGDVVELGAVSGVVEAITLRTTLLRDLDGDLHHVPNGTITLTTNKTIDFGSVNEDIVVGKDTDIDQLEHIIKHLGEEMATSVAWKDKLKEAPYMAQVKNFHDNGVVIKIIAQTVSGDQWDVKSELYRRLLKAFKKHGVELPYPQVVVHQPKKVS